MADKVDTSEHVNSGRVTEEANRKPLSLLLPLPHFYPSSPPSEPPSDRAYLQASAIFQRLRAEKPAALELLHYGKKADGALPESGDKRTQRRAYQLAFNTLKYQDLLEDIIADSCFHTSQHISADLLPLAMVMLCDFQDRRFSLRERSTKEAEEPLQEVRDLESSLRRCKTKLAASLARCRVKLNLQSVSCFLSDPVRTKHHRAKRLPLYAWVNTLEASVEEVMEALQSGGWREEKSVTDLQDLTFCRDPLCPDTLVFPRQLHARLQHSGLASARTLNVQDRSLCVAVSVLRPLLFDHGDVLVAGSFSPVTVAHVAVAAADRSGRVLVCAADHAPSRVEEIQEVLAEMDIKNVRFLSEAFLGLNEWDSTTHRLKVIIVLPQCSSSALSDPVPTMHSEHGNWDLLPDLSHGSVSRHKIHTMTSNQVRLLAHALTFPKVQTVVYCTRSVYPEENEQLVKRVLEKTHTHPKLLPFRVNGPIFPVDSESGDATDSKFFRLEPSQFTNGCFIARLSRQVDPTKVETVQDVLARAAAKGLLGGIIPELLKPGKKRKGRKNREASSSPSSQERQTGGHVANERDPDAASEREVKGGDEEGEEGAGKEKKTRGRKRKLKRRGKQKDVSKNTKGNKKKPTKTKVHQSSHSGRPAKSKQRRIPRLTLKLMSSEKPYSHLSPITALAHRLNENPADQSQHTLVFSAPSSAGTHPSAPPAASKQPKRAGGAAKDGAKPGSPFKGRGKAADSVLPPIPLLSCSSSHSSSGGSVSPVHSQTSSISASSSSASLPGLQTHEH